MSSRKPLGGIIHTYQSYDPKRFPSPTQPSPDVLSPAFEHLLTFGHMLRLTDEELARAIKLDPSMIAGLGPTIDSLIAMLEERRRKILATYETDQVQDTARRRYRELGETIKPPRRLRDRYREAFEQEQLRDMERLWYRVGNERAKFARAIVQLVDRLGNKYQVDELAARYEFTGRTAMSVPRALEVKEELDTIERLLEQLNEAAETAQIGLIDMDELAEFAESGDLEQLGALAQQIQDYLREVAQRQGLDHGDGGFQLTPKAYRLFQGRLLEQIFSNLEASRSGRHTGPVVGEGAVETQQTKPYEFGDSITHMDIPASLINAMVRGGPQLPVRMKPEDIEIYRTRNVPKCATAVLMDMSGSMRYGGQYINVKRMALALDGLIRREYPGDFLQFIEIYTFAKARRAGEVATLMPKPVTLFDPIVRLKADMSSPEISELHIPPHFTNIQHGLQLGRQFLSVQDTPNRQIILITDGLPTAHFEEQMLFLLYPPSSATEEATMREGMLCQKENITINIFLLPGWSQTEEDIQFAYRLAEATMGRVFFCGGRDLDRYVVWDYLNRRRQILA